MRDVLVQLDRGEALQPLRLSITLPGAAGTCWLMPACAGTPSLLGVKVLTAFPGNAGTSHDTHQGAVLLFGLHGELLALIDATSITAIRTAAVSAVATDALARADAKTLAILGSGAQAMSHLEAMLTVRPIARTFVWSRSAANAERFAREARERIGTEVMVCADVASAVAGADIICTTTAATMPILEAGLVRRGAHINAVGSGSPAHRELAAGVVRDARVFVDRVESALHEAGDIVLAMAEGVIRASHLVGELGAVLSGRLAGRRTPDDITLFKSVGLGVEDVAAAQTIFSAAMNHGIGITIPFGNAHQGVSIGGLHE